VTVEEALAVLGSFGAGGRPVLPLPGEHQRLNAALALATVRALADEISVGEAALREGMSQLSWPGRMQLARTAAGQTVLLDGAHNAASAVALRDAITKEFPGTRPALVLGVLADKDWESIASALAPLSGRILLVPVHSERTLAPEQLGPVCRGANAEAAIEVCSSLADGLQRAIDDPFLLITGSLYLVGEALELLGLSPDPPRDESGLNEWGGIPAHP
jgi:dihydrofolate synthase/folylpolyglutamate synthase